MQGPYVDCSKPTRNTTECHECDKKFKRGEPKQIVEVYDDPWAVKPRIIAVHGDNEDTFGGTCFDKLTDTSWADFRYFLCSSCDRMVISQCPSNGWRSYVKHTADDKEICVKCYQDMVLEDGHGAEPFEADRIPGDFFNSSTLSGHGWGNVPGFHGVFISGADSAKRFRAQALKLTKEGHKVLVNYDSMGIGGGEGYVSLYAKEASHG